MIMQHSKSERVSGTVYQGCKNDTNVFFKDIECDEPIGDQSSQSMLGHI